MPLPPQLLQAVADVGGGRITLVVGAGCSVEDPTCVPLSRTCSLDAHRRLIDEGLLQNGDCPNPEDLSALADAVFDRYDSQRHLVERLPLDRFRKADPNSGYKVAAAMLAEGVIGNVLTLNFDLAIWTALTSVDVETVGIVTGPQDHAQLRGTNLIFLHRTVNSEPEDWILRTDALDEEWKDRWEEVVAQRVVASPVVVFAGLGSPAGVLTACVQKIRAAVVDDRLFQVNPGPKEESVFFEQLALSEDRYIQCGWCDFMALLERRLIDSMTAQFEDDCQRLLDTNGWHQDGVPDLCRRLSERGLLALGAIRARWSLSDRSYIPKRDLNGALVVDLLLVIGLIENTTGTTAHFEDDGRVVFLANDQIRGTVFCASGGGHLRWATVKEKVKAARREWSRHYAQPNCVIVSGVPGGQTHLSTPDKIVSEADTDNIVSGEPELGFYAVDTLRDDETIIGEILKS